MTEIRDLSQMNSATANASGVAEVTLTPLRSNETWHVTNVAITSTSTAVPTAKTYRAGVFRGGTYSALFNNDSDPFDLLCGQPYLVRFEGCTPGALCTVSLSGETRR